MDSECRELCGHRLSSDAPNLTRRGHRQKIAVERAPLIDEQRAAHQPVVVPGQIDPGIYDRRTAIGDSNDLTVDPIADEQITNHEPAGVARLRGRNLHFFGEPAETRKLLVRAVELDALEAAWR